MSHLSPEMDRLLWEVAESQDSAAFDDFETRFPAFRVELAKRITMVRELRGARKPSNPTQRIPQFTPRYATQSLGWAPTRAVWVAGGCILAAAGLAAFVVTKSLIGRTTPATPPPVVRTDSAPEAPKIVYKAPTSPITSPNRAQSPTNGGSAPLANNDETSPLYLKPLDLKLDRAPLQTALRMVASSGGLRLEIAPNTPNPAVRLGYSGMNAIDILRDLGRRFNFTAMDDGNNTVLIVPARDGDHPETPSAGGSGFATNLDAPDDKTGATTPPKAQTPPTGQPGRSSSKRNN